MNALMRLRTLGQTVLRLFSDVFGRFPVAVEAPRKAPYRLTVRQQRASLSPELASEVDVAFADWEAGGKVSRLWKRDATLWTSTTEGHWMGWLGVTDDRLVHLSNLAAVAEDVRDGGFDHALLLGMGGSSLCPEVLKMTFGRVDGFPELHVLDSTDPAQIRSFERRVDLSRTLYIVSSKSGSTLEPSILKQYFFNRVSQQMGADRVGGRFIAVTDPGSELEQIAERESFRSVFRGVPSIGGRYSALSDFGLVPASVMGLDAACLLDRADEMVQACAPSVPARDNPGVALGLTLGLAARQGRDKVTIVASPRIWGFGAWLEQLLAESTGKRGRGLIPIDREHLASPEAYGADRLFVYLRLESAPDTEQDAAVTKLEHAGQAVVRIALRDSSDLGQEFFRWEVAVAVAGAVLGVNPFDQPDVEASKDTARRLTSEYEATGALPGETPVVREGDLALYTGDGAAASVPAPGSAAALTEIVRAHLERLSPGDYFAVLAYVEMNDRHDTELQALRHAVRDATRVATCLSYGPRFLHSTGQAYKGGPNSGVFLQITCDDALDLSVPGQKYTFGVVKAAQARGDFEELIKRGRRVLWIHIGCDVDAGLKQLRQLVERAVDGVTRTG